MSYSEHRAKLKSTSYWVNGEELRYDEIVAWAEFKTEEAYLNQIKRVYLKWFDDTDYFEVTTSGSTGNPKNIILEKVKMFHSAKMSLNYFNLQKQDSVLLVLPANKIGGIMLIIRTIINVLDLHYLKPRLNPFENVDIAQIKFCSLTPAQLTSILSDKVSLRTLRSIDKILLGGSKVKEEIIQKLRSEVNEYYIGFGMTETISHIAVYKIDENENDVYYQALEDTTFALNENQQLVISSPSILEQDLVTNDIVELRGNQSMKWLGRFDNVVNSGGIKLIPEWLERKMASMVKGEFYLVGEEDDILGEKLVLVVKASSFNEVEFDMMKKSFGKIFEKNESPKGVYLSEDFNYTKNGKLIRSKPYQLSILSYKGF